MRKAVQDRAIQKSADLPLGHEFIPQVGWTACELLASEGQPTRVELQQTTEGRLARWWYQNEDETHQVSLRLDLTGWVVDYVSW